MKRLIRLEFNKLRGHRGFWILFSLYLVTQLVTILTLQGFLNTFFEDNTPSGMGGLFGWDLNSFPDNFQYLTWLAGWFHYILGVVVIILICNEFNYRTVRQNIIDGMSRREFLLAKFLMLLIFAGISTLLLLLSILALGFIHTGDLEAAMIFEKMPFILAFFLQLVGYLMFAFLVGMLVRKVGIAIGIFFIYAWFLENVILYYAPEATHPFFPMNAFNKMIRIPFTSMDPIDPLYVGVSIAYILLFLGGAYLYLKRRDL